MEQNVPVIAKKMCSMVRVILFMLRIKGISKRKLMLDLDMMLKRGNKLATKAINHLMFHYHHRHPPPRDYEFSCSNTPNYTLPKRRHHYHNNFFACAFQEPRTIDNQDDNLVTMNAVKLALEMLNNNNNDVAAASPLVNLPGFGKSPAVRQLRITDSPFPMRDDDDEGDNGVVDMRAEEFIQRFYRELRMQRIESPAHIMSVHG